jgi:hypothetical protein
MGGGFCQQSKRGNRSSKELIEQFYGKYALFQEDLFDKTPTH